MYTTSSVIRPIKIEATEYDRSIAFISSPENFDITQKYASLACEIIIDPAPIASTQSSFPFPVSRPNIGSNGK
jgi:hypothetical protein